MAKEEKILSVRVKLRDSDFEDVYRIYLDAEKNRDKRIGLVTCIFLCVVCLILMAVLKNITFLFYAAGCAVIGIAYFMMSSNKKFIATNKLLFGEWRETTFYQHSVSTMEIFEKNESEEMEEEEIEEATTYISTNSMKAYESARGFLFADGKIVNQFLYLPKRDLTRTEIAAIREFAENNCSGDYELLEAESMVGDTEKTDETDEDTLEMTSNVCDQFYGAKKLHLYDADGHRVGVDGEQLGEYAELHEGEEEEEAASHTEIMDEPELDLEEAVEEVLSEDSEAEDE